MAGMIWSAAKRKGLKQMLPNVRAKRKMNKLKYAYPVLGETKGNVRFKTAKGVTLNNSLKGIRKRRSSDGF